MSRFVPTVLLGAMALVVSALAGCAAADDPAQEVYALEAEYDVAVSAELAFAQSPAASPADLAAIKSADQAAYAALAAARVAARSGAAGGAVASEATIAAAQSGLAALTNLLSEKGALK